MRLRYLVLSIFLIIPIIVDAQFVIKGRVLSENDKKPVPFANVILEVSNNSVNADINGQFEIEAQIMDSILIIIQDGFRTEEMTFTAGDDYEFEIFMKSEKVILEDVEVRAKSKRYRNKNNPAVELVRKVNSNKELNRMDNYGKVKMKMYEKINFGSSNIPKFITRNPILRPFRFVFENFDTNRYKGSKTVILFLDENWSDVYFSTKGNSSKKIIKDRKRVSLDPTLINEDGTISMLNHLYQNVNIYDENFLILTNNFTSPISGIGPMYYKYFITDTTIENGLRNVHLDFTPRNKQDLLVEGNMVIGIDENHVVKQMNIGVDKRVNINFVDGVTIHLKYDKGRDDRYFLKQSIMDIKIKPMVLGSKNRIVGTRTVIIDSFTVDNLLPDSLFTLPNIVDSTSQVKQSDTHYYDIRPIEFNKYEYKTYENLDSMRNMAYFKNLIYWSSALGSGYLNFKKIEIGNLYRTYSENITEGSRIRIGMRTNPMLIKRYHLNGYLAYGTLDKTYKYLGNLIYSLKPQQIYDYPQNYLKFTAQYDAKVPGRVLEQNILDNVTDNIQRGVNDKFLYARTFRIEYVKEFQHNLLFSADATWLTQEAKGSLYFLYTGMGDIDTMNQLVSNNLGFNLRWSPGEKFYNDRIQRKTQYNKAPRFTLRFEAGFKGILGGQFDYQRMSLDVEKRFYLGSLGLLDAQLKGNYLWGELPYPLLNIPRANQAYTYNFKSYNLMNFGEFVTDKQLEFNLNYRMFGFIFNKIPLIKKLKFREVAGFKMIYGGLNDINNPAINPNAMKFPANPDGKAYIHLLNPNTPYMEWNVGIENIFNVLRIDYVRRISYLDNVNVSPHRLMATIVIDF